jgi:hypothetical protein
MSVTGGPGICERLVLGSFLCVILIYYCGDVAFLKVTCCHGALLVGGSHGSEIVEWCVSGVF